MRRAGLGRLYGLFDSTGRPDVIVLYQNGVVESEAVVLASARPDRIFLQDTQARGGLPRVRYPHAGVFDQLHEPSGFRRDA